MAVELVNTCGQSGEISQPPGLCPEWQRLIAIALTLYGALVWRTPEEGLAIWALQHWRYTGRVQWAPAETPLPTAEAKESEKVTSFFKFT